MGFKRTSEGRVFFQGGTAEQGETPLRSAGRNGVEPPLANLQSQQTQVQILTLLKALNERLKATQADRARMERELEAYRTVIEGLEERAGRSERAYLDLERKIAGVATQGPGQTEELLQETLKELQETRRHILDLEDKAERAGQGVAALTGRQVALETLQREQAEKAAASASGFAELGRRIRENEEKQESLSARIEETGAQQARLIRKVDKAIEDRIRFMRKIERIEETVIQTRDSLNARAMVLLTDQGAATAVDRDLAPDFGPESFQAPRFHPAHEEDGETVPLARWGKPYRMRALGLSMLVVASLVGGWFIGELQKPQFPEELAAYIMPPDETLRDETQGVAEPVGIAEAEPAAETEASYSGEETGIAALDWGVDTKAALSGTNEGEEARAPAADREIRPLNDDIGTLDLGRPEDVEALLEKTPEEAAALLNTLEPSPPTVAAEAENTGQVGKTALKPEDTASPPPVDPHSIAKPDPALPEVVKEIEKQAFDGVPEAQHDLAAIYTAGHGGVKQDYKRAAFWFEQAAGRGVANAAYNLGVLHHQGLGMKADMKAALSWYSRAAALDHPEAQYNLGIAYIEGIGVGYDPEKAADFFMKAADRNIMEAAYNLGLIYENGLLGEAKPDEALMWYKTAADQGSPQARQALEQLARSLGIKLEDVNRLVENMKTIKKSESAVSAPASVSSAPTGRGGNEAVMMAQIQEYLQRAGLFPGPADGVGGALTEDAIRAYQKRHGLNPDGKATQGLLTHMLSSAPDAKPDAG